MLIDEADFKTQIALAAISLSKVFRDSDLQGSSEGLSNPMTPLRMVEKLLILDDYGLFTVNEDYINRAYLGEFPNVGSKLNGIVIEDTRAPTYLFSSLGLSNGFPPAPNAGEMSYDSDQDLDFSKLYTFNDIDLDAEDMKAVWDQIVDLGPFDFRSDDPNDPTNYFEAIGWEASRAFAPDTATCLNPNFSVWTNGGTSGNVILTITKFPI